MAKNFGFNIGGGGIANLIAAPQVRPVATRVGAPVPTLRDKKEPEESLKGALLGALAPTGAKLGLAGLSKVPGLENLLFKPEPTDSASGLNKFQRQITTALRTKENCHWLKID